METDRALFNAPIPGESLTAELGGRPWQTPPKLPTVDEAIDYYMERMSSEEFMEQLIEILESGVPVAVIANTIQLASVMDGIHSVDVGMLVVPVIMEMIMFLGDSAGIEYNTGMEKDTTKEISDSKIARAVSDYRKKIKEEDKKPTQKEPEIMPEVEQEKEPAGLMARRK